VRADVTPKGQRRQFPWWHRKQIARTRAWQALRPSYLLVRRGIQSSPHNRNECLTEEQQQGSGSRKSAQFQFQRGTRRKRTSQRMHYPCDMLMVIRLAIGL
jgi:hypothetical protein